MSTDQYKPSSATGWVIFAAAVMLTIGAIDIIQGLAALLKDEVYVVTESGLLVTTNFTAWGWSLIIWGVVLILAALALFSGKEWGRWFAIVAIIVNGIGQIAWFPAYPLWSLLAIGLEIAVLYALTAGWKEREGGPEGLTGGRPDAGMPGTMPRMSRSNWRRLLAPGHPDPDPEGLVGRCSGGSRGHAGVTGPRRAQLYSPGAGGPRTSSAVRFPLVEYQRNTAPQIPALTHPCSVRAPAGAFGMAQPSSAPSTSAPTSTTRQLSHSQSSTTTIDASAPYVLP